MKNLHLFLLSLLPALAACAMVTLSSACTTFLREASNTRPCKPQDLAKIESDYVAEATKACLAEGAHSRATCKAFPAIEQKYQAQRKAWVECK